MKLRKTRVDESAPRTGLRERSFFQPLQPWVIPILLLSNIWASRAGAATPQLNEAWVRTEALVDGQGLTVDNQGAAVVAGSSSAGAVVLKYDAAGKFLWRDVFGSPGKAIAFSALTDPTGNIWTTGLERAPNASDADLVFTRKYSGAGQLLWHRNLVETGLPGHSGPSRVIDSAGNIIVAGIRRKSEPPAIDGEYYIIKYSPTGDIAWSLRLAGSSERHLGLARLALLPDGGVILSSYGYGVGGVSEFFTSRIDTTGTHLWTTKDNWNGTPVFTVGVAVDAAGNSYVAGTSVEANRDHARIVKYDPSGQLLWTRTVPAERYYATVSQDISVDSQGRPVLMMYEYRPERDDPNPVDTLLMGFSPSGEPLWLARDSDSAPLQLKRDGEVYFHMERLTKVQFGGQWILRAHSTDGYRLAEARISDLNVSSMATDGLGNAFILGQNLDGLILHKFTAGDFTQAPKAVVQPAVKMVAFGNGAEFKSEVSPTGPVTYQWFSYGVPQAGETNSTLVIKPVLVPNFRANYALQVSNTHGATLSPEVRFRIQMPPSFYDIGQTNELPAGRPLLWYADGGGEPPVLFQWYRGDGPIPGRTNRFLEFAAVNESDSGTYSLVAKNDWGIVTNGPFVLTVAPNSPFDAWQWRNPLPQGNDLLGAAYGNGHYVAIGNHGTLIRSSDGVHWNSRHDERFGDLNDIAFAAGQFVAIGANGKILVSSDGTTWEQRGPGGIAWLGAVAHGNGTWVVVGTSFVISTNGLDWTLVPVIGRSASDVAFGAGRFVALNMGEVSPVITSTDGRTWEPVAFSGVAPSNRGEARISFGEGRFVIVSRRNSFVSPDGKTWQASVPDNAREFNDVAIGPAGAVAVGTSGGGTDAERSRIFNSADFLHWTTNSLPLENNLHRVARLPDRFLAMGDDGNLLSSPDGNSWTAITIGNDVNLAGVAVGGGTAVAVGDNGHIFVSRQSGPWDFVDSGGTNDLNAVAYGAGKFVAVGQRGQIRISEDGIDWMPVYTSSEELRDVIYANQLFVAVGDNGMIARSTDGLLWLPLVVTEGRLQRITFGNGRFVASGDLSEFHTSTDGSIWTVSKNSSGGGSVRGLAFGNNTFVAVGGFSGPTKTFATSADGTDWIVIPWDRQVQLQNVHFIEGHFVALGSDSQIYTSLDGRKWLAHFTPCENDLNAVVLSPRGTVIVVGNNHAIIESSPLRPTVELTGFQGLNADLVLRGWPGRIHRLQASPELDPQKWEDLGSFILPWPQTNWITGATSSQRFYRLVTP